MDSRDPVGCSEYERLRLQNIQRNDEYLAQIGFSKTSATGTALKAKKRKAPKAPEATVPPLTAEPTRRSARVASLPITHYKESQEDKYFERSSERNVLRKDMLDIKVGTTVGLQSTNLDQPVKSEGAPSSSASGGMCSTLCADVHYFLGGSSGSECGASHRLCVPVERYGKAEVMQLSNGGLLPRFSKYCGAVEWRNCVYLWVNVGGSSGYSNAFSEEGRHMMWFGGSRMHADSAIVKRLLRAPRVGAERGVGEQVLLFVRLEGENYCCLGRVRWVAVDLLGSPIKVKWELADFDSFQHTQHFKSILRESGF